MFHEVEAVLLKGQEILKEIGQYRGASKEIREVKHLINMSDYFCGIFSFKYLMTKICQLFQEPKAESSINWV